MRGCESSVSSRMGYDWPKNRRRTSFVARRPQRQLLYSKCPLSHLQAKSLQTTKPAPLPAPHEAQLSRSNSGSLEINQFHAKKNPSIKVSLFPLNKQELQKFKFDKSLASHAVSLACLTSYSFAQWASCLPKHSPKLKRAPSARDWRDIQIDYSLDSMSEGKKARFHRPE